jgi:hypothetical protein
MQPIEYRRLGDPMIIRISVTLGCCSTLGPSGLGIPGPDLLGAAEKKGKRSAESDVSSASADCSFCFS